MSELIWSPRSVADLQEIRAYIEADAPAWADLTVRRLVAAVERLRQFPDSGRMVPERQSPELREVVSGKFLSCIDDGRAPWKPQQSFEARAISRR